MISNIYFKVQGNLTYGLKRDTYFARKVYGKLFSGLYPLRSKFRAFSARLYLFKMHAKKYFRTSASACMDAARFFAVRAFSANRPAFISNLIKTPILVEV